MRSGFGARNHPLLGYSKMHTGVDWAAPLGTPIYASGNGLVDKVGWESGYGKYIRIRHANGYETAYGHMTAFARSIQPGARVRQGQVIGYVGSTGLSTGPHLHYEILVNGRFVDPLRVKLPRGRVLDGPMLDKLRQGARGGRRHAVAQRPARRARPAGRTLISEILGIIPEPTKGRRPRVRSDGGGLFRGDGVAQRERRCDAMQMLDAAHPIVAIGGLTGANSKNVDRAVVQHSPED